MRAFVQLQHFGEPIGDDLRILHVDEMRQGNELKQIPILTGCREMHPVLGGQMAGEMVICLGGVIGKQKHLARLRLILGVVDF